MTDEHSSEAPGRRVDSDRSSDTISSRPNSRATSNQASTSSVANSGMPSDDSAFYSFGEVSDLPPRLTALMMQW